MVVPGYAEVKPTLVGASKQIRGLLINPNRGAEGYENGGLRRRRSGWRSVFCCASQAYQPPVLQERRDRFGEKANHPLVPCPCKLWANPGSARWSGTRRPVAPHPYLLRSPC